MELTRFMITTLLRNIVLGAFALILPAAHAAEVYFDTVSTEKAVRTHGSYFGAFGGFGVDGADADYSGAVADAELDNTEAAFGGVEFGYTFSTPYPIRPSVELEILYLDDELKTEFPAGGKAATASANLKAINASINVILALDLSIYEEDIGSFLSALHPYIGAGFGGAWAKLDSISFRGEDGERIGSEGDNSGFEFTYQIFGGLEIALSDVFSIYAEYKYLVFDGLGSEIANFERPLVNFGFKVQY